ncbi:hypothetical protein SAG0136_08745 [Streptococcus agalactiae LMG 14747]|uniref:Uncharacterized protein n=1 Tax=Streptococcus agalactiae LMG 14747 TaxID=1154860 RepID=V6Z4T1_STRAG|nr:hypothetical protein SAG0136_08745 [Streptococcus agalactiae LMG 14747]
MGLKTKLATAVAAYISYKAFNRRHDIKQTYTIEKARFDSMSKDKDNIQKQVAIIKSELAKVNAISQEIGYNTRVFQQDLEPRLKIIKDHTDHLQNHLNTKKTEKN